VNRNFGIDFQIKILLSNTYSNFFPIALEKSYDLSNIKFYCSGIGILDCNAMAALQIFDLIFFVYQPRKRKFANINFAVNEQRELMRLAYRSASEKLLYSSSFNQAKPFSISQIFKNRSCSRWITKI
jgi:hypothetical protein